MSSASLGRTSRLLELDELIAAGWGNVPQPRIPENWRDIPAEVNKQDLERIRDEEFKPEKERIKQIERSNERVYKELAAKVMENQSERRKRGRPPLISKRRFSNGARARLRMTLRRGRRKPRLCA